MIKGKKSTQLAFIAIWLIIATCIVTDLVWLRNPVLLISAVPISAIVGLAMYRLREEDEGGNG